MRKQTVAQLLLLLVALSAIACGCSGGSSDEAPPKPTGTNPNAGPPSQSKTNMAPLPELKK